LGFLPPPTRSLNERPYSRTEQTLGIALPPIPLARADEVIE
jgi:hypothetical protein